MRIKVNKQVAAEHGLEGLTGRGSRLLLTGSQGSGKSRAAAEEIADLDGDMVVWWTVPTIDKAEEQAGGTRKLARPGRTSSAGGARTRAGRSPATGQGDVPAPQGREPRSVPRRRELLGSLLVCRSASGAAI